MKKRLLAAGYLRDIEFDSQDSMDLYIYSLEHKKLEFKILDKFTRDDGSIIIRILQQYNNAEMVKL